MTMFRLLIVTCLLANAARADVLTVAVAANFRPAAEYLARRYQRDTGQSVRIISGASGKLYAQIINGAPFDVFLSADQCKPLALVASGQAVEASRVTYAVGRLVLWIPSAAPDSEPDWASYKRIALANPKTAPYGAAAIQIIDSLPIELSQLKLIQGENVAQVYQFVASQAVDAGFVALSLLHQTRDQPGSIWSVPSALHTPIKQDAVITAYGARNNASRAFLDYLLSQPVQQQLSLFGYELPQTNDTELVTACP